MCGIAGKVNRTPERPVDPELIRAMTRAIAHRGPDDEGFYVSGRVGLGMRRLSIIDLAGGHQPIANEDGSIRIVFNGEIYNYREIRKTLEAKGHRFATRSDTEVIVHLYEEKGVEALHDLRGMFAFALWDAPRERLFLARDRVGKKPLCYAPIGGGLAFGSEIKALLVDPSIQREVDPEALDLYLSFQFVPAPRTMFQGIFKLPPGHYLLWERGEATVTPYWRPPDGTSDLSMDEAQDRLLALLTEAVDLRLVSDVPIGAFLSGGLDSATVVGLMSRLRSEPVRTFSIGFAEDAYNELPFARQAADAFKTMHREFTVRPNVVEILPQLVRQYDEPFADKSAIPTFYLCREAAKDVKVALSGDGGDEAFAGYSKYAVAERSYLRERLTGWAEDRWGPRLLRALWTGEGGRLAHAARRKLFRALCPVAPSLYYTEFFDGRMKRAILNPEMYARLGRTGLDQLLALWEDARGRSSSALDQMLRIDFAWYLPGDLLVKMDLASMAHGLEVRSPLLDHRLLEFAFSLPPCYKVAGSETKLLLKRAAARFVPEDIVARRKMGFGLPLKEWFRGELRDVVRGVLLRPGAAANRWFHRPGVERLVDAHLSGRENHAFRLWALIVFHLWHQRFIEGEERLQGLGS